MFSLLFTAGLGVCSCLRPEVSQHTATSIARLGEAIATATRDGYVEGMASLQEAVDIAHSVMMQAENKTAFLSDADRDTLTVIIGIIEDKLLGLLSNSTQRDQNFINGALQEIAQCNSDMEAFVKTAGGGVFTLAGKVGDLQSELNVLEQTRSDKAKAETDEFDDLKDRLTLISGSTVPACNGDYTTIELANIFFQSSPYVTWYESNQQNWQADYTAWDIAVQEHTAAFNSYTIKRVERDTTYCDFVVEERGACERHQECYERNKRFFSEELTVELSSDMSLRVDAYKAGKTVVAMLNYLLANETIALPDVNLSAIDVTDITLNFGTPPDAADCQATIDGTLDPEPTCKGSKFQAACEAPPTASCSLPALGVCKGVVEFGSGNTWSRMQENKKYKADSSDVELRSGIFTCSAENFVDADPNEGSECICYPEDTFSDVPSVLWVPDWSVYPGGSYDPVTGNVRVTTKASTPGGEMRALSLAWELSGVDPRCGKGEFPCLTPNCCGIHVHTGTSCATAAGVGGHYYRGAGGDPWEWQGYYGQAFTEVTNSEIQTIETGLSASELIGHVVIIHDHDQNRVACGVLQKVPRKLYASGFRTDDGTSSAVSGVVIADTYLGASALKWNLEGLDRRCVSSSGCASDNCCQLVLRLGSCGSSSGDIILGTEYEVREDFSGPYGYSRQQPDGVFFHVAASSTDLLGDSVSVYDYDGSRIACASLG